MRRGSQQDLLWAIIRGSPQVSTSSWDHPYSVLKQMDSSETTLTSCPLLPSTGHLLKVVGQTPQGCHQHDLPDRESWKDSTSGNKVALKTSADHVPAETFFPESPGKVRVEMNGKGQNADPNSTSASKHKISFSKRKAWFSFQTQGKQQQFSPQASHWNSWTILAEVFQK